MARPRRQDEAEQCKHRALTLGDSFRQSNADGVSVHTCPLLTGWGARRGRLLKSAGSPGPPSSVGGSTGGGNARHPNSIRALPLLCRRTVRDDRTSCAAARSLHLVGSEREVVSTHTTSPLCEGKVDGKPAASGCVMSALGQSGHKVRPSARLLSAISGTRKSLIAPYRSSAYSYFVIGA